jgi:prepilin-type N-terminal cleavage/methylation domain-containing protein
MKPRDERRGFTLTEMLVAIGIMVLVMGMAVPVLVSSRARTRRVDAINAVRSALAAARQAAVKRRTVVAVEFVLDPSANRGDYMLVVDKSDDPLMTDRVIGNPVELPDFVKFDRVAFVWTVENGWPDDPSDDYDQYYVDTGDPDPTKRYPDIAYLPDGTVADTEGTTDIYLVDTVDNLSNLQRVLPATGLVINARHLQDPIQPEGPTNPRDEGWL